MESSQETQTIQRYRRRSTGSFFKELCAECNHSMGNCLCPDEVRKLGRIVKEDLKYIKNRLFRTPSIEAVCGKDDENRPHICSIKEAPSFLTSNPYITGGYRTFKSKEKCIKGILLWTNETINIWTHLGPFLILVYIYLTDVFSNYDNEKFSDFDKKLSGFMMLTYLSMLGLSSVYHIFNCCCCTCYRYWYGWDFVGVCASIYGYGFGFLFLQFREAPAWIAFYGVIKTIIAGIPIGMTFSEKYFQKRYDDSRSVWIGGFVIFNVIPIIHSILLRGGISSVIVQYTLPDHLVVMFLLVGSYIIYVCQFPERLFPGKVNFIGHSHQVWHVGTATAVFFARHLYFQYIRSFQQVNLQ